jgi:tellurite resistance protein TerC
MVSTSPFGRSFWITFIIFFTSLFIINRLIFNKRETVKDDYYNSLFWFTSAMFFTLALFIGSKLNLTAYNASSDFLTGYLIELSLSIDNLFIFLMIFDRMKLSNHTRHLILNIGIISAIIMRFYLIFFAIELVKKIKFIFVFFGIILIYTALKIFFQKEEKLPKKAFYYRFFTETKKDKFFVKKSGKILPTTNLLALLLVEKTDLIFALDSIPAILTVTQDFFIVFTANVFALVGLRALFFTLAHKAEKYYLLKKGVMIIIFFIGIKLILLPFGITFHNLISVMVITLVLTSSILLSIGKKA